MRERDLKSSTVGGLVLTKTTQLSKLSVGVVSQRLRRPVFFQKVKKTNVKIDQIDGACFSLECLVKYKQKKDDIANCSVEGVMPKYKSKKYKNTREKKYKNTKIQQQNS